MATIYKNILLKDNSGHPLLPITLSYYVEYRNGVSVQAYLDTLSGDLDNVNSYIDGINNAIALNGQVQQNIINSMNDILVSYVQKPVRASYVAFDNTSNSGLTEGVKNLLPDSEFGYVSTQQAIEAIDLQVKTLNTYTDGLGNRIETAEGDIDALESSLNGYDTRITNVENKANYTYNNLFDNNGQLDLTAESIKYEGKVDAGTESLTGDKANVQEAIDFLGAYIKNVQTDISAALTGAGVTYVTGTRGVLVDGKTGEARTNSVVLSLNIDEDKLILNSGVLTVDDSKLELDGSQITTGYISTDRISGGLGADNINVTYTYSDGGVPAEGTKSVQEFYDETTTSITNINNELTTLSTAYQVTLTDDQGASSTYARVYTINQGGHEIGTINIPKDQFLKKVEYAYAADGVTPALVFTWNSSNPDATNDDTTYVPIESFIDAITGQIAGDITTLQTSVGSLETRVGTLEGAGYITGVTLDGVAGTNTNGVVALTSKLQYEPGTSTERVSDDFLTMHGIPVPTEEP